MRLALKFHNLLVCRHADRPLHFVANVLGKTRRRVHVAVVPGTDFGVPHDLRLAFCNDRYNEGIDRLREYFTASAAGSRSTAAALPVQAASGTDA